MHAVVKTGGKQYRVAKGDIIEVEKLDGKAGDKIDLETLMVGEKMDSGSVKAEIANQKRADKVIIFKKKRRQGYRRTKGHRQEHTVLKITDVSDK